MYWADRVAKEIIRSDKFKPYWVDDMKTLSGYPTIGSLRGPFVHDFIYKALQKAGAEAKFTYIFNDFDPVDDLPPELKTDFSKYLGFPLKNTPSPKSGYPNYADYFAADFGEVLREFGISAQFLSSYDMYHEGKFDGVIKIALDNAEKIADIYQKVSGSKKREANWLPFQVVCENCGKLGTTRVHNWDGEMVEYICQKDLVKWAVGCGNAGRISPYKGSGKLPWKVDWPAHWKVLGVTIEGAGKDHSSAGGSRDIASELCKKVFKIPDPYNLPYEFFLIGGKKMSTSKGIGLKAREAKDLLPSSVVRFLFCRSDYHQTVEFDPIGTMAIPDLFDEYDRCFKAFIEGFDETLARTFEMAQVGVLPKKIPTFLIRFRDVVNFIQMPNIDIFKKCGELKRGKLNPDEIKIIEERVKYAKVWLDKYAPDEYRLTMAEEIPAQAGKLDESQKEYLKKAACLVGQDLDGEALQLSLYNLARELKIDSKRVFSAIYNVMSGKNYGPKAGPYLRQYPKEKIIERFEEATK